ncbi:isopentenyl diphosphate isomerase/L-lactate dehydrogenase-like FMN-dependent dehydrogenase [Allocatelliglobosispora scoriae]|uniref:Isopentenyl diphosphate isomerase/L-lactate dehydrogenase-like FMN-dependent dehydrogenase n=1 Tax=Allocatelliglobosispora scoriae TaxID=643052 RepID=A0A841BRK5_9ACTN|nr:lactate 2-monooxygenase [Allocatelliglobosispora scoriae]MBB5870028.1 isopentenyl diphosphate isomerase/L-lactate dehydrogenase-like FMN-dependent dehydrogenase [Allocatelliglobosispora scoriae]
MEPSRYASYQQQIFRRGLAGELPPFTVEPEGLEESARRRLGPGPFAYVYGPAGAGTTMRANREAFDRWRIVPRMLTKSTTRYLATTVLGTPMPAPVLVAPLGVQSILHPEGELATARAAAELGLTMVLSTMSSFGIEEVAEASGAGPRWFQLYWPNDDDLTISLLNRAKAAGYTVLVVTLDTMSVAWRPSILDKAYLPMLRGTGIGVFFTDPVFRSQLARSPEEDLDAAVAQWDRMLGSAGRAWDELGFLREHWDGPIVIKGVTHVDDARQAAACGLDGVIVSNHGGRQVDGAIAALDVLPEIVDAVGDRMSVLFDSGIRTGADALKALAIGAEAVLIGRPFAYGLGHAGQLGVTHVLRSLLADLELTMGLSGYTRLRELTRDALRHQP